MTFNLDEPGRRSHAVARTDEVERGDIGVVLLAAEIAVGRLKPEIAVEPGGSEVGVTAWRLVDRDLIGKAVLHIR
jgi:hypothetical protein